LAVIRKWKRRLPLFMNTSKRRRKTVITDVEHWEGRDEKDKKLIRAMKKVARKRIKWIEDNEKEDAMGGHYDYLKEFVDEYKPRRDDLQEWCGLFTATVLYRCGWSERELPTLFTWSLDWEKWGDGIDIEPMDFKQGDILVFNRGDPSEKKGHITFLWEKENGELHCLEGNQGQKKKKNKEVIIRKQNKSKLRACRRPRAIKERFEKLNKCLDKIVTEKVRRITAGNNKNPIELLLS